MTISFVSYISCASVDVIATAERGFKAEEGVFKCHFFLNNMYIICMN